MNRHPNLPALPSFQQVQDQINAINAFREGVHRLLVEGVDYGVIPGTGSKPTLLKPGAEKVIKMLNASARPIVEKTVDLGAVPPFINYDVTVEVCEVGSDVVLAVGVGNCNSWESKYRYRNQEKSCPACGGEYIIKGKAEFGGGWLCWQRKGGCGAKFADGDANIEGQVLGKIVNEDTPSLMNTLLKQAKKRAVVDASLSFACLSDLFTQDLDDGGSGIVEGSSRPADAPAPPAQQKEDLSLCDWHSLPMDRVTRRTGKPYHKIGDEGYCNGCVVVDKDGVILVEKQGEEDDSDSFDAAAEFEDYLNGKDAEFPASSPEEGNVRSD